MADRPLLEQILLDEIQGKYTAIHACDRMSWTVRTGFCTVIFGSWGILLTGLLSSQDFEPQDITTLGFVLWFVSAGLSICAFLVDRDYVRRKSRVIVALDAGLSRIVDHATSASKTNEQKSAEEIVEIKELLSVTGYSGDKSYKKAGKKGAGYKEAIFICAAIYTLPCLVVAINLLIFYLFIGMQNNTPL